MLRELCRRLVGGYGEDKNAPSVRGSLRLLVVATDAFDE